MRPVDTAPGKPGRRWTRRWIGAGLAVVVVAVVVFVVAQGSGSGSSPLNAIAKAAEVTQREPGGRAVMTTTVTSPGTSEGLTETGAMTFDDGGRARGMFTVKGHKTGREEKILVVVGGKKSYVSSESLDSIPEGKKWMEIDYSSATSDGGSSNPAEAGPQEGLKILKNVLDAEAVGKEEIEGVPTTHYRGTLPTSSKVFGVELHVSTSNIDVWIDAQEQVRQMHVVISGSVGESSISTTTEISIDFLEFGRVPKIEIPNPDEVFNATSEIESQVQAAGEG